MEMKDKEPSSSLKVPDVGVISNVNPSFTRKSSAQSTFMAEQGRIYSYSELANLTIFQVAREGDVMLMEKLLERIPTGQQRKKRVNARDESKLTPMHYAARYDHYNMIKFLIDNGASVETKGEDDATPLHFIAKYKKKKTVEARTREDNTKDDSDEEAIPGEYQSCVELLVNNGAQLDPKDAMGMTPFHQACTRGNTRAVRDLLECPGLVLEMSDQQGMTGLHLACLYGHKSIVKLLLKAGSNFRCKNKEMTTPLHLACSEGSVQVAQLLFDKAKAMTKTAEAGDNYPEESQKESNAERRSEDRKGSQAFIKLLRTKQDDSFDYTDGIAGLLSELDNVKNLPLHLAIENGHTELVKLCIETSKAEGLGSMVNHCRSHEDSCLHLAVQANSFEIVKLVMEEQADVNARNSLMVTPLLLACQLNAYIIVKHLLKNGANIEMKDSDFMTPLLVASRYGHLETIRCLLEYNADVTETDKDDRTCLMWAAEENRIEALQVLLEQQKMQLMIEERDKFNNTALHLASVKGHTIIVQLLLENRASADIKNDNDHTTLHMAALHGQDAIIPELVKRDRSIINAGDEDANSALHLACIGGNLKSVSGLVHLGANIELRNAKQWTPLDCAAANGWVKPVTCLLEAGASIQPKGKIKLFSKVCALHLACQRGHVEVVQLLLRWKADVTFRAADGRNSLDFAIDFGQKECVLALIKHETWQLSMKNAIINPANGLVITPMRRLISRMEDMAEVLCNQCITDNGKKPENEDYAIALNYEFFDDMYSCNEWMEKAESRSERSNSDTTAVIVDDTPYTAYDEAGQLTTDAQAYSSNSHDLEKNHPLQIMVNSKCEKLLIHPLVTGLLNHKWRSFGRYVYYSNLLFFVTYHILLNVYMLSMPPFYQIDWKKLIEFREYLTSNNNTELKRIKFNPPYKLCDFVLNEVFKLNTSTLQEFANLAKDSLFYRWEVARHRAIGVYFVIPESLQNLTYAIIIFASINLIREIFQVFNQRLRYISFTNSLEVSLYLLSLILSVDFQHYSLCLKQLETANLTINQSLSALDNLQIDTGIRQKWQHEVGAFSIFLSWMSLLLFIRKIPKLGIFVVMFTDIMKTFGQFFVVFMFFIFGFSLAFTVLLGNMFVFEYWFEGLVSTTVMMIGELDYSAKFYSAAGQPYNTMYHEQMFTTDVTFVLFYIFLLVMTIITMNLLVGLAVGDIIQVQQHATLGRVGMRVALALEVEFTLPGFLHKRLFVRNQTLEVNKSKKANFLMTFFAEDDHMSAEHIIKSLDKEVAENEETRSESEKILFGLSTLRGKMIDVMADQADLKNAMAVLNTMLRDLKNDTKIYSEEIQGKVDSTSTNLNMQIDKSHTGLLQKTQTESDDTRGKVETTKMVISGLRDNVHQTKEQLNLVRLNLEERMDLMQQTLLSQNWKELELGLRSCRDMVKDSRLEMAENIQQVKFILMQEKLTSRV